MRCSGLSSNCDRPALRTRTSKTACAGQSSLSRFCTVDTSDSRNGLNGMLNRYMLVEASEVEERPFFMATITDAVLVKQK